jgi:hypothetical protein
VLIGRQISEVASCADGLPILEHLYRTVHPSASPGGILRNELWNILLEKRLLKWRRRFSCRSAIAPVSVAALHRDVPRPDAVRCPRARRDLHQHFELPEDSTETQTGFPPPAAGRLHCFPPPSRAVSGA